MNSGQLYLISLMCFLAAFIPLFLKSYLFWFIFNLAGWTLYWIAYQKNKKENGNN